MDDGRTVGRDSILRRRGGRRGCGNNGDVIFRADRGFPPNDSYGQSLLLYFCRARRILIIKSGWHPAAG